MHPSARQPAQKGPDSSAMDLALHASDLLLASTQQIQQHQNHDPQPDMDMEPALCEQPQETLSAPPPLMHFPHCRLEITSFPTPNGPGKLEQIALPGALVRTLLSRFESDLQQLEQQEHHHHHHSTPHTPSSPSPPSSSSTTRRTQPPTGTTKPRTTRPTRSQRSARHRRRPVRIQPHFDDGADWVFSRCLLADFTGFREDEAEALSTAAGAGRLCCWASVVLQPPRGRSGPGRMQGLGDGDHDGVDGEGEGEGLEGVDAEEGRWELEFVVQRVGVRDPGSGWCECF
ncbi:hypothetical protein B0I37DRAFT_22325 [Chaetomium sp. MPI-CAGE-AT-0009]|nr:hypothetical protein B0I37DRAFT_22325 [Chaetomium sp. MPI-CAGE-AT-0009]